MQTRSIGEARVSEIGLGGMPLSIEGRPDRDRATATVHAALDAGVTLIDTADAYHLKAGEVGHNESLIAEALASYGGDTSGVLVATKGGHLRPGDGSWTLDGRPEYLVQAAEASLKRLGVEAIGLYQFHRPDPDVPYAESVGALAQLLDAGKIRMAGVSNADPDQIREANEVLGGRLVSVQNQYSARFTSAGPNWTCAPRWASRSCPGARSVASRRRPNWVRSTRRSPPWHGLTEAARSRWRSPGCSPPRRSSSRSRAPPGRRRSATPPPPPT